MSNISIWNINGLIIIHKTEKEELENQGSFDNMIKGHCLIKNKMTVISTLAINKQCTDEISKFTIFLLVNMKLQLQKTITSSKASLSEKTPKSKLQFDKQESE